jgi:hypothetical protein
MSEALIQTLGYFTLTATVALLGASEIRLGETRRS